MIASKHPAQAKALPCEGPQALGSWPPCHTVDLMHDS